MSFHHFSVQIFVKWRRKKRKTLSYCTLFTTILTLVVKLICFCWVCGICLCKYVMCMLYSLSLWFMYILFFVNVVCMRNMSLVNRSNSQLMHMRICLVKRIIIIVMWIPRNCINKSNMQVNRNKSFFLNWQTIFISFRCFRAQERCLSKFQWILYNMCSVCSAHWHFSIFHWNFLFWLPYAFIFHFCNSFTFELEMKFKTHEYSVEKTLFGWKI